MAGSIQLYTDADHQGLRTFPMASFTTTDLVKGTDYIENYIKPFVDPNLDRNIYCVKLTIGTTGIQNLQVDKTYSPIPETDMLQDGDIFYPSNCDVNAALLTERPLDWDLHWRDKYNQIKYAEVEPGATYPRAYSSAPIVAPTSFGVAEDPPFVANTYSETAQGRYLFWTMSDRYFAVEAFWEYSSQYAGGPSGTKYTIRPFYAETSSSTARGYSNWIRLRSVSGPVSPGSAIQNNLKIVLDDFKNGAEQRQARIHLNFVNFNYDVTLPSQEVVSKQMIGFVIWRTGADGVPIEAQISAFEKEFWEGVPEPPNDGPTSSPQGGRGSFSAPSDNRGDRGGATASQIASRWNGNVIAAGYNNYYVSPSAPAPFKEMCERLWDPSIIESWINQSQSPLQAIITCHQLPATLAPTSLGASEPIKAAGLSLSDTAVPTFSQYITSYHVGDIDVSQYTDSFADFTNTSIYIHLPYVGTYQLDTAACMHGWLAVDYLCDVTSGHCTALITTMDKFGNTQIRYEFKGDCSKTVPIYQRENPWAKVASTALNAAITIGATAAGGAVAGIATNRIASSVAENFAYEYGETDSNVIADMTRIATGGINQSALNAASRSGAIGGAIGSVGSSAVNSALSGGGTVQSNASGGDVTSPIDTECWVLITRPQWSAPEFYDRERAYPSDIAGTVGDFSGLLMVSSCELNGIDCTDQELHEIDSWLKSGVLLD